jgi:hypothetical protein
LATGDEEGGLLAGPAVWPAEQAVAELAELEAALLVEACLAPVEEFEDEASLWPLTIG